MPESYLINESLSPWSAYVYLTLSCNLKCRHCYLSAGPNRKESMPMRLRKRAIQEIAKNEIKNIVFTGGEPTIEMDMLIETLKYVIEKYKEYDIEPEIVLQTNAYFLTELNDAEIKEKLEALKSEGICVLNIASRDNYHDISASRLDRIAEIGAKVFGPENIRISGAKQGKKEIIFPIGRARLEVPKQSWWRGGRETCEYDCVIIAVDGGVYPCCYQATPAMGDLSKEPLIEIINRARGKNSIFRKLAEKGGFGHLDPEQDLAINKEELQRLLDKFGQCGACAEYWRWHVP